MDMMIDQQKKSSSYKKAALWTFERISLGRFVVEKTSIIRFSEVINSDLVNQRWFSSVEAAAGSHRTFPVWCRPLVWAGWRPDQIHKRIGEGCICTKDSPLDPTIPPTLMIITDSQGVQICKNETKTHSVGTRRSTTIFSLFKFENFAHFQCNFT